MVAGSARGALWRAALVVLLLASIPVYALQFVLANKVGDFGLAVNIGWADAPSVASRVEVEPGSPAWRAGIRSGDVMVPVSNIDGAILSNPMPGDRLNVRYVRAGVTHRAAMVAVPFKGYPDFFNYPPNVLRRVVDFFVLAFALLVVLRAWNTEYGPITATILTGFVVASSAAIFGGVGSFPIILRPAWVAALCILVNELYLACGLSTVLLMVLLRRIVGTPSWPLRALTWLSGAILAMLAVAVALGQVLNVLGRAGAIWISFKPDLVIAILYGLGACALLVAIFTARGAPKQRVRWLFWGFAPFFAMEFVFIGAYNVPATVPFVEAYGNYFYYPVRIMDTSLPIALFYGVLVKRVVDIGFVFNRVAVYGLLSVVLFSIFTLLEYAAGKLFVDTSRAGSLFIQLGVALAIAFSARYLHKTVDQFVDRLLFAKRHADESALRHFAHETEAFASEEALLDRALGVLREHSETGGTAIYLAEEGRACAVRASDANFPGDIDIDDPLLVKLRRWNEPADTNSLHTAFPDGMVFPMTARGKLIGALACRAKTDGTAFDPDERASLLEVARGLGSALHALSSTQGDELRMIRESIAALAEAVASLAAKVDSSSPPVKVW